MENDLTNKMLRAVTGIPPLLSRDVSMPEKMDLLMKFINDVPVDTKKRIGKLILTQQHSKTLSECTEGVAVRLDELPGPLLVQIYDIVMCVMSSNSETGYVY